MTSAGENRTTSSTTVAAPPQRVLDVIADLEAYPEWAGDVRAVTVLTHDEQGRPEQVRFRLETALLRDEYVLAYRWDDAAATVSWTLVESTALRAMDGSYVLTPLEGGAATGVEYALAVELAVPLPGMLRRRAEKAIVSTALTSLKRRAES
ncbi:MAG: SRPBCC family protein [Kineosporiaceae bacterium]